MKPDFSSFAALTGFRCSALALAVSLACLAPSAHALRIGGAEVRSAIGQPLDLVVPLSAEGDASFQPECVRVLRDSSSDGIPGPGLTRLEVEPRGSDYLVRVRSLHPVNEPAIKLVLEAGCAQHLRRDFVLLLDPPREAMREVSRVPAPPELPLVLGEPALASARGEPLRLRVPVTGREASTLDPACVAVTVSPGGQGQALVRRIGNSTSLLVSTSLPIEQARIALSIQAGCVAPVVRDYSLLLAQPSLPRVSGGEEGAIRPATPRKKPRPAVAQAPAALETPAAVSPSAQAAPGKASAAELRGGRSAPAGDRLILAEAPPAASAEGKAAEPSAPDSRSLSEREAAINAQLEALNKEMAELRSELAAAQARNAELIKLQQQALSSQSTPSYAWVFATVAALALALGLLLAWRSRKPLEGGWADDAQPEIGPATRIGVPHRTVSGRPAAWAPAVAAGAGGAAVAVAAAPVRPEEHAQDDDQHAIHVTEFANTSQLIHDLYSDYIDPAAPMPAAPRPPEVAGPAVGGEWVPPAAPAADENGPLTKTQLAVDLDVGTLTPPTEVLGDWDDSLFLKPREDRPAQDKPAAAPLAPLDFELKFDLPAAGEDKAGGR